MNKQYSCHISKTILVAPSFHFHLNYTVKLLSQTETPQITLTAPILYTGGWYSMAIYRNLACSSIREGHQCDNGQPK